MAREVLPIVGAVVGSFIPGVGTQIGFMIGSVIGNAVDPMVIRGPSIGDGAQQTSKEGVPRPIIYGTACVAGNLIDRSEIRKWIKKSGGKGGPVTEEERMSMTFAIRICEGPIGGILRIWEDEKLVYDVRPNGDVEAAENDKYTKNFRFYRGDETQLPDPALEAIRGPGDTPSYRGTAYIVFDDLDVTDRRGSVPNFRFEVFREGQVFNSLTLVTRTGAYDIDTHTSTAIHKGDLDPVNDISRNGVDMVVNHDGTFLAGGAVDYFSGSGSTPREFKLWKKQGQDYVAHPILDPSPGTVPVATCWHPEKDLLAVVSFDYPSRQTHCSLYRVDDSGASIVSSRVVQSFAEGVGSALAGAATFMRGGGALALMLSYKFGATNRLATTRVGVENDSLSAVESTLDESLGFVPTITPQITFKPHPVSPRYLLQYVSLSSNLRILDVQDDVEIASRFSGFLGGGIAEWNTNGSGAFVATSSGFQFLPVVTSDGRPDFSQEKIEVPTPDWNGTPFRLDSFRFMDELRYIYMYRDPQTQDMRTVGYTQGTQSQTWTPFFEPIGFSGGGAGGGLVFASEYSSVVGQTNLSEVLSDISDRVKFPPSKLDLSEVGDTTVRGFVVAGLYDGHNVIRSLQDSFLFDPAEWDRRIRFVKRGKPVVLSIDENDLVEEPVDELRESAREYPQRLELFYQNPDVGYAGAKAVAERLSDDYQLSGAKTVEVPVTMTVDEAWQVADMQLKVAWEEAKGQITLTLPSSFDFLTPTDCIGFFRRGVGNRLRITEITSQDGTLEVKAHYDRQSAYTSDVVGLPVIPPTKPPPTIAGPTTFQFLNTPALVDQLDPVLHYYYGATGVSDAWHGAVIQRAVDDDEFSQVSNTTVGARMGELVESLPYASEHYPDTTHALVVRMYRPDDELEAVSQSQLLREKNGLAIAREDGTAELVQFRDLEEVGENTYRLTYLLRGRLNSKATPHEPGARVVVLEDVVAVTADPSLMGAELQHRPVSYGESPEDAPVYTHTWQPPLSQVEWPVDQLELSRDGDSVLATWSPRERFGTDINPVRSQNWQAYRVLATDGANSMTIDTLQPSVSLDVSGWSGPVTVAVSQVNRYTGPGPAVSKTID